VESVRLCEPVCWFWCPSSSVESFNSGDWDPPLRLPRLRLTDRRWSICFRVLLVSKDGVGDGGGRRLVDTGESCSSFRDDGR